VQEFDVLHVCQNDDVLI